MVKIDNDRLPGLPNVWYCDDGYDWMGKLSDDWKVIPNWQGEEMGDWPYVIVAACDDPQADVYGYARYVEGDVILGAYDSHRERDNALENYHLWQMGRKNT
ncbi:hypothetical protein [Nocardiopsis sp. JB363]|uniref:hypothetical protein n=1 Tax=Nocardiopsis sp. JB363 TaxID=1434837 RepID=UPI00097A0CC3|nr:hypothetical protein [Nocardiopsis sp. JB363]SIO86966.1 hypothetical protein BQ8420_14500 [Nocardiopsis sp. JB363]